MDGRRNNGGHSTKGRAGRKSKAEELKVLERGVSAIEQVYGTQEQFWAHIAKQSKDSLQHLKILLEYVYGKPKQIQDITHNVSMDKNFPAWMDEGEET